MSSSSMLMSIGAALSRLGVPHAASIAMEYAANAFGCEPDVRSPDSTNGQTPGQIEALFANMGAAREKECVPGPGTLPEGFVPIREARNLAVLGRWQLLDDKMPPCLPLKLLLTMQRRCEHGDPSAAAWMGIYERAFSGEVEAQRAFGKVCENGVFRAPADLQRAFFWYYRAALQGDAEARHGAERVARSITIPAAAMAEPALVYPGSWRITAGMPGGASSSSVFELAENGTAQGCLIGSRGAGDGTTSNPPSAFVGPCAMFLLSPQAQNAQYSGQWAYHMARKILTFDFAAALAGVPGKLSDAWQIELVGCRMGALFGRDRRMVSYTLEYAAPRGNAQPADRVSAGRQS